MLSIANVWTKVYTSIYNFTHILTYDVYFEFSFVSVRGVNDREAVVSTSLSIDCNV